MTDLHVNQLRVLRDTCRKVQRDNQLSGTGGLGDVITKLDLMIVDATTGPALQANRANAIADSGYAGMARDSAARPSVRPGSKTALAADHAYWRALDHACISEAKPAPPEEDVPADSASDAERALQLGAYLRTAFPSEKTLEVSTLSVMTAGYSKKTYLATLHNTQALPDRMVVRADQADHYVKTTVVNEFDLLDTLKSHGVAVPHPFLVERSGTYFGAPFMLVELMTGKTVGDPFTAPPFNDSLVQSTAEAMASYHRVPLEALARAGVRSDSDTPHIISEFDQYLETWRTSGLHCPTLDVAFEWISDNIGSALGRVGLVHNDFNYNNMLVEDNRVTAILDWEFAHIGNPAADIGYYRYAADRMGAFDLFKRYYEDAGGILPTPAEIDFYYIWGMTRLGVMILQAQAMFDEGRNLDLRFAVAAAKYLRPTLLAIGAQLEQIMDAGDCSSRPA